MGPLYVRQGAGQQGVPKLRDSVVYPENKSWERDGRLGGYMWVGMQQEGGRVGYTGAFYGGGWGCCVAVMGAGLCGIPCDGVWWDGSR